MSKIKKLYLFETLLIVAAAFYYFFFANKGLVLFDEGYFVHNAERIFNGQLPYKDFALQYGPTFFYLLALLYKIFGPSIIVGRILTVSLCLLIVGVLFLILNKLKVKLWIIFLAFLSLISFGYPLINIPNIVWLNVLLSLLLILVFIYWLEKHRLSHIIILGILLALSVSAKQNLGLAFVVLFTLLMMACDKSAWKSKLSNIFILELSWGLLTFSWIYYFFLRDNLAGLWQFIEYSRNFVQHTAFSYPPLTMLFQPLGFFKLLPYYLPVLLFLILVYLFFQKKKDWKALTFILTATVGFFASVFPQSDLLHTYPFLGMVLVSFLLLKLKGKTKIALIAVVLVTILTGFYLTFFTKSYRYERLYLNMSWPLNLPRTQGILVEKDDQQAITKVASFIDNHTTKNDYIFAYPDAPLLYFILDRKNPSKDSLYEIDSWHFYSGQTILKEVKDRHVKYIITQRGYIYDSILSHFVQKQKLVLAIEEFKIFEVITY